MDKLINSDDEKLKAIEAKKAKDKLVKSFTANDNVWGHSVEAYEGKKAAMAMLSTKTGMYAKIPLVCKGEGCPYSETCELLKYGLYKEGEKCSFETAMIETYYAKYMEEFDLDSASFTDKTLVKEIIDCDIKMERSQALLTAEQLPIKKEAIGVTEDGDPIYKDEISKAYELHERNSKRKERLLAQMMATRRDKAKLKQDDKSTIQDILSDAIDTDFVIEQRPDEL